MHRYTEEQVDTTQDQTAEHTLNPEIACVLAEQAVARDDWEQVRAWLEVADKHGRKQHEPFEPAIERRTPRMGGLLPAPWSLPESRWFAQGAGRLSSESEALHSLQREHGAPSDGGTDDRSVAPMPQDTAVMIPPPMHTPRLLVETLGFLFAIALVAWALWAVAG